MKPPMMTGDTTELLTKLRKRLIQGLFCLATSGLLFISCKRDCDDVPPVIYAPQFHAGSVLYLEELLVSIHALDESQLTEVTLSIVDATGREQLPSITYTPSYRDDITTSPVSMNSVFMDSGTYYIKVSASDGENSSMRFFSFDYIGAARQLNHVWAIRGTGDQRTIDTLSNGTWQNVSMITGPWISLSHWPRHQHCSLMSHASSAGLPWFDPDFMSIQALPDSITTDEFDAASGIHYWGLRNGDIYLTEDGSTRIFYAGDTDPTLDIAISNQFIFVLKGQASALNRSILVLHKSTGYPYHFASLTWDAKGMIAMNDDEVYIIGNQNQNGHIERFINSTSSIVPVWQSFQSSAVRSIWPGDAQRFYVVHADGIVRYSMDLMDYQLGAAEAAQSIVFENIHERIYVRSANGLILCDSDGNYLSTLSTDALVDVFLEYNK
ncbi:MAG: hypothetical protein ACKOZY_01605 [Flavobacteriales bacterium]